VCCENARGWPIWWQKMALAVAQCERRGGGTS
jgi:hypothetical protein